MCPWSFRYGYGTPRFCSAGFACLRKYGKTSVEFTTGRAYKGKLALYGVEYKASDTFERVMPLQLDVSHPPCLRPTKILWVDPHLSWLSSHRHRVVKQAQGVAAKDTWSAAAVQKKLLRSIARRWESSRNTQGQEVTPPRPRVSSSAPSWSSSTPSSSTK